MISTLQQATQAPPPTQDERAEAISERLAAACQGMRVASIAAITGVHAETVRRYLLGKSPPSAAFLAALCDSLGLSPRWMLLGEGHRYAAEPGFTFPEHATRKETLRACLAQLAARIEQLA